MNILMIGPDSNEKGGIATVIKNFGKYSLMSTQNYNIHFLTSWMVKNTWKVQVQALLSLRKVIKEHQIDIVHFHVAQKGSFYRKVLLSWFVPKRCRLIFHMHASQFDVFYAKQPLIMKKFVERSLNRMDLIVALSIEWQQFYQSITKTPISIIENAVEIPEEPIYVARDSKKVITLGRVGERKGSYDILTVAQRMPAIDFFLFGDGEIEKVRNIVEQKKIKNVKVMGWISAVEKEALFSTTDLHFLPSYHEGLPMSILETMSYGIPNMGTNIGGIPQVITKESGMLVSPGDVDAMVEQINEFFQSGKLRTSYSKKAREKIEKQFSLHFYFDKWNETYEKIMGVLG